MPNQSNQPDRPPRCPVCRQPSKAEFAPFCSAGCRNRDLVSWLDGRYAIPAQPTDDDDG